MAGIARGCDAIGNTAHIGGAAREFIYNADDRLSQVKQAGLVKASYRYNARGERVARADSASGPASVLSLYDEAGHWVGDYSGTGVPLQQTVWMDDTPAGLLAGAAAAQKLHYLQADHLGTPRAVIDPARNVAVWAWDAKGEAFGNSVPNQDPDQDGAAFVLDRRFPGQRYDAASGLNQKAAQAAIFEARTKMNDMLIDKGKMYGTPGWGTHAAGLRGRLENIAAMISLGQKVGCDMSTEIALAADLILPSMPR